MAIAQAHIIPSSLASSSRSQLAPAPSVLITRLILTDSEAADSILTLRTAIIVPGIIALRAYVIRLLRVRPRDRRDVLRGERETPEAIIAALWLC